MGYVHKGKTLYRTVDDRVVEEGDPDAAYLLVADGGTLSDEDAARYGLTNEEAPSGGQAAQDAPKDTQAGQTVPKRGFGGSQDKARRATPETKADDDTPAGGLKVNREK